MAVAVSRAEIKGFRAFHRFYNLLSLQIDEGQMTSGRCLAEVRVLRELSVPHPGGDVTATFLGELLRLDNGYLSRILKEFRKEGLVQAMPEAMDRRRINLTLTRKGEEVVSALDQILRQELRRLLEPLVPAGRRELLGAMRRVELLLSPGGRMPRIHLRRHRPGDMGWVVASQSALFAAEYNWGLDYEAMVLKQTAAFLDHHVSEREACVIAEADGERAGAVFIVREPVSDAGDGGGTSGGDVARIRLLHVERAAQGLGIGNRLMREAIRFARDAGYQRLLLWASPAMVAARRLYSSLGFRPVRAGEDLIFGGQLAESDPNSSASFASNGEIWELYL